MRLKEGQGFAGYTVVRKLGRGGMASVYLAAESGFARQVALKILPEDLADEPSFVARFQQEAQTIASLEHPSIVPLYRFGIEDGVPWMALRYVAGGDLARRLAERPLGAAEGFSMLGDVARALDHAHRRGVIHRDLKPQNILLDEEGHAYLADFGVAKLLAATALVKTGTGSTVGTPAYMSPEQALGHELTHASDLYALGVICFQWWTGLLPFDADTPHAVLLKHALEPLPEKPLESMTPAMRAVLMRAMAKDPSARYPNATALVDALRDAQTASAAATPPPAHGVAMPPPLQDATTTPAASLQGTALTPPPPLPPQPAMTITPPSPLRSAKATARTPALVWWMLGGAVVVTGLLMIVLVGMWLAESSDDTGAAIQPLAAIPADDIPGEYEGFLAGKPLRMTLSDGGAGIASAEGEADTSLTWREGKGGEIVLDSEDSDPTIRFAREALLSGRYVAPIGLENGPVMIRRTGLGGETWPQLTSLPTGWAGSKLTITCEAGSGDGGWVRFRDDGRAKVRIGETAHDVAWVASPDAEGQMEVRISGESLGATLTPQGWASATDFAAGACLQGALAVDAPG
jgi:hypothetical protein